MAIHSAQLAGRIMKVNHAGEHGVVTQPPCACHAWNSSQSPTAAVALRAFACDKGMTVDTGARFAGKARAGA